MPVASEKVHSEIADRIALYAREVQMLETPGNVLARLHDITADVLGLSVLGAMLLPRQWGDWQGVEEGKTVFIHESAPKGWWNRFAEHSSEHPGPALNAAYIEIAPFTLTEILRATEPTGIDRRATDFTQALGIRDLLCCPIGKRWLVAFWSRHVLDEKLLPPELRMLVFMGAIAAAIRLRKIIPRDAVGAEKGNLTPREKAVLRLLSSGKRVKEIADYLDLGEETVRSHIKKLQVKLDASTHSHAVAQAMRLGILS